MTGVLLVNMGGPESPEELRQFLKLMFLDKHIIPAPAIVRSFLSRYISSTRYKRSWDKYKAINGTPIKKNTEVLAARLQSEMGDKYDIGVAYSYSPPLIPDAIKQFAGKHVDKLIVIPLYPHSSFTTTHSVLADISKTNLHYPELKVRMVEEFHESPQFVSFWVCNIMDHIKRLKLSNPYLLFSAHSIPLTFIEKGDSYPNSIELSAKLIAQTLDMEHAVSYQSHMKPKSWLGPDISATIRCLAEEGKKEIVIIPFSFASENLETLYDLDKQIIPLSVKETNINLSRVVIPQDDPLFIDTLKELIHDFNY
jgi:protoporphyrin/coproporphyrin ferrochelatase